MNDFPKQALFNSINNRLPKNLLKSLLHTDHHNKVKHSFKPTLHTQQEQMNRIKQSIKQFVVLEDTFKGFLYPEGNISEEYNLFFNHSMIENVLHLGYETEEEKLLQARLQEGRENSSN